MRGRHPCPAFLDASPVGWLWPPAGLPRLSAREMLRCPPRSPPALTPRPAPADLGSKRAPRFRVARSRAQQWRRRRRGRGISDWVLCLPPPRAASFLPFPGAARGSARGTAPMRLRLDAAPPARGSVAQRSTRLRWGSPGDPGTPRAPRPEGGEPETPDT